MKPLKAYRAGDEFHFVLGAVDGYGWCDIDEDGLLISGGIDRAASGSTLDYYVLAGAIDALTDAEFVALCENAPSDEKWQEDAR